MTIDLRILAELLGTDRDFLEELFEEGDRKSVV